VLTELLPQPGGFEGQFLIQIDLAFEELAVSKAQENRKFPTHRDAASRTPTNDAIQVHDAIFARIQETVVLAVESFHRGVKVLRPLHHPGKSSVGLSLEHGSELDLGVNQAQKAVRISCVVGIDDLAHDLDVLLRHRLRSISREAAARGGCDRGSWQRFNDIYLGSNADR
jgi:hypothetical protein